MYGMTTSAPFQLDAQRHSASRKQAPPGLSIGAVHTGRCEGPHEVEHPEQRRVPPTLQLPDPAPGPG